MQAYRVEGLAALNSAQSECPQLPLATSLAMDTGACRGSSLPRMVSPGVTVPMVDTDSNTVRSCLEAIADELTTLRAVADVVCSSPLAAIISGEQQAGVFGSRMLILQLPLRVFVASIGRLAVNDTEMLPRVVSCRSYDHRRQELVDLDASEGVLYRLPTLLYDVAMEHGLRFLPTDIAILSEGMPGRGLNWSGALAASVALLVHLLNGGAIPPELVVDGDSPTGGTSSQSAELTKLYRMAMRIETSAHGVASGLGPAVSLLPSHGEPFVYQGHMNRRRVHRERDDKRSQSFSLNRWSDLQLGEGDRRIKQLGELFHMFLVDPGTTRQTSAPPKNTRTERVYRLERELKGLFVRNDGRSKTSGGMTPSTVGSEGNSSLAQPNTATGQLEGVRWRQSPSVMVLGELSNAVILTLRDCYFGAVPPTELLGLLSSIATFHRLLGLNGNLDEDSREELIRLFGDKPYAAKPLGAGLGGHILVAVARGAQEAGQDPFFVAFPSSLAVTWDSSTHGIGRLGARWDQIGRHMGVENGTPRSAAIPHQVRFRRWPFLRLPVAHVATVVHSDGTREHFQAPSLFGIRMVLQSTLQHLNCHLMFESPETVRLSDQPDSARHLEPVYFIQCSADGGFRDIRWFPHKHDKGFRLLRRILHVIGAGDDLQACDHDILPQEELAELEESVPSEYARKRIEHAQSALNAFARSLFQAHGLTFPTLHYKRFPTDGKKVCFALRLPKGTAFVFVRPQATGSSPE